jgi:hypothetical protein
VSRSPPLALLLGLLLVAPAAAEPIAIDIHPITQFALTKAGEPRAPLAFLGGISVTSPDKRFGGFSGLDFRADGTALVESDSGVLLTARLLHEDGRLVGLADADIASLFPDGSFGRPSDDVEDLALDPADRSRGVIVRERQTDAMLTFDVVDGRPANFTSVPVDIDPRVLRSNFGLESVAYAPADSPLAGSIVTIAERPGHGRKDFSGEIIGRGDFTVARHDHFDISSIRFLPGGDLLILERRYAPAWGIAMRLRRIAGASVKAGARLDGPVIFEAGITSQIDNMEGLAVSRDASGRTILTLVSDDNHSVLQRTLILQFALVDG